MSFNKNFLYFLFIKFWKMNFFFNYIGLFKNFKHIAPIKIQATLFLQLAKYFHWIFFILVLAFSGDIAAYYVGSRMGKRKLLPKVSPGKTVEGTIGLVVVSIAGCLLFRQLFFPLLSVPHAVILGLVGSIAGQLGDLCESALKRAAGVKDSGVMLPGHGGILDRLDCLMFITPFMYYYRVFIIR